MAGNLLQVGSDNKLRVKTNGLVVAGASDACCCAPNISCANCSIPSTKIARVTFSGISYCGDCITGGGDCLQIPDTSGINGTFDCVLVSSNGASECVFQVDTGIVSYIRTGSCVGAIAATNNMIVRVIISTTTVSIDFIGGGSYYLYNRSRARLTNCTDGFTLADSGSCAGSGCLRLGEGGTAVLTFV